jgi:alanyl-tRNA synthetase
MKMTEIESKFFNYFRLLDHKVYSECSIISKEPDLYFVNAGMCQFKDIFLRKQPIKDINIVSNQTCLRLSGKHNDLDNIGVTPRHHSSFKMLGNFSFGGYGRSKAIIYAYNFLTKELMIAPERLMLVYHSKDTETKQSLIELSLDFKSIANDSDDNLWKIDGINGYSLEIFYLEDDNGSNVAEFIVDGQLVSYKAIEIWNIVFMEFDNDGNKFDQLFIDTGMGLERIASIMQNKSNTYDIIEYETAKKKFKSFDLSIVTQNVLADHFKTITLLLDNGIKPSANKHGYILRLLIRRCCLFVLKDKKNLDLVVDIMSNINNTLILNEVQKWISVVNVALKIINNNPNKLFNQKELFILKDRHGIAEDLLNELINIDYVEEINSTCNK